MKKILTYILIILFGVSLTGCLKIDFGKPDDLIPNQNNTDIPTSVVVESINNTHKLFVDETLQLKVTINPETVNAPVVFSSNNEDVATVDNNGLVTGVSKGIVKITAKVTKTISISNVTTVEGYIILTVEDKQVQLEKVEIEGPSSIYIDELVKLEINKEPANANVLGTWQVDNEEIAVIDQNGRLKGLKNGTVLVTYFVSEEVKATLEVEVLQRTDDPASLEIIVREQIEVGETVKAYIESNPAGSINQVAWSSMDESIATIDGAGNITAISAGEVMILAKYNAEIEAEILIKVEDNRIDNSSLEQNLVDLVRVKKDSVLGVSNYQYDVYNDLMRNSIGSGFVYKVEFHLEDGSIIYDLDDLRTFRDVKTYRHYLITNRHVVEGADALKIYLHNEDREIDARLLQYDNKEDIAVIRFDFDKYIKPLKLADSDKLEAGRFAVAIGNPNGYEFSSTATFGIISHPNRFLPTDTDGDGINDWDAGYIQHDVAINPGNSGGPLFNLKGEVIGVNTLKYVSNNIESMGFSVPSNIVKSLIPYLENGEIPNRAKLGVQVTAVKDILNNPKSEYTIPEDIDYGLYVISVVPGSVADEGGILANDIIVRFNNLELTNLLILRVELNQIIVDSNTVIDVVVYRNGEYVNLKLIF